ncbi:hypothetical protein NEUTE2DRAFT_57135 [Neurospora tetrasperma FGSC 2509]|nr:hypothetical protein NEUTE2DRAFT_57135 [Neurospora tetrasperma FGSC 2509]
MFLPGVARAMSDSGRGGRTREHPEQREYGDIRAVGTAVRGLPVILNVPSPLSFANRRIIVESHEMAKTGPCRSVPQEPLVLQFNLSGTPLLVPASGRVAVESAVWVTVVLCCVVLWVRFVAIHYTCVEGVTVPTCAEIATSACEQSLCSPLRHSQKFGAMTGDDDGTIEASHLPPRIITEYEKNVHVDVNLISLTRDLRP